MWVGFNLDDHFHGVVFIRARNSREATNKIIALGLVPEDFPGKVVGHHMPPDFDPPEEAINRLLSGDDWDRLLPGVCVVDENGDPI